jgi:hypothetical protein
MPESIDSERGSVGARSIDHVPGPAARIGLGLLPAWILLIQLLASPSTIEPLGANPPSIAGLPAGILLVVVALVLAAIGVLGLRRSSSTKSMVLWLSFFTLPSIALVLLAPAAILLVQLLAT